MKDKIIVFVIGLLLGAIISTGSIYIYTIANKSNNNGTNMQMIDNGGQMSRPDSQDGQTPPEIPTNQNNN